MTDSGDGESEAPPNHPSDDRADAAATRDEFHELLQALVTDAARTGVDVRGGWPVADGDGAWDVEIVRLGGRSRTHAQVKGEVVQAVVEAVAAREGVETTALPPLYESIDPEILETMFGGDATRQRIAFQYCGYTVTVHADGTVFVDE